MIDFDIILSFSTMDIYSGVYKKDRKLIPEKIKEGKLIYVTTPSSGRRK